MLPLLAEIEPTTWIGAALAATPLAIAALFGWLGRRDQLRYDAEVLRLRLENAHLGERVTERDAEIDELKAALEAKDEQLRLKGIELQEAFNFCRTQCPENPEHDNPPWPPTPQPKSGKHPRPKGPS